MHENEAGQSLGRLKLLGSIGMTSGSCHLGVQGIVYRVEAVECMDAAWTLHGRCTCGSGMTSAAAATCASN